MIMFKDRGSLLVTALIYIGHRVEILEGGISAVTT
jgi:hypothetical protein